MRSWPFRLERRAEPSVAMSVASPLIAAAAMLLTGFILFSALGKSPAAAFHVFFIEPVASAYGIGELLLKATPLMLCALGLAIGFRANVWNIGAEGCVRATFFKYVYLEYSSKLDYARYSGLHVYQGKASQAFGCYEMILSLGFRFHTGGEK